MSHKSEMAGPFNRGDTIINKHFLLYFPLNFLKILYSVETNQLDTDQCPHH